MAKMTSIELEKEVELLEEELDYKRSLLKDLECEEEEEFQRAVKEAMEEN